MVHVEYFLMALLKINSKHHIVVIDKIHLTRIESIDSFFS